MMSDTKHPDPRPETASDQAGATVMDEMRAALEDQRKQIESLTSRLAALEVRLGKRNASAGTSSAQTVPEPCKPLDRPVEQRKLSRATLLKAAATGAAAVAGAGMIGALTTEGTSASALEGGGGLVDQRFTASGFGDTGIGFNALGSARFGQGVVGRGTKAGVVGVGTGRGFVDAKAEAKSGTLGGSGSIGVHGMSASGLGVVGSSASGTAIQGTSAHGYGGWFSGGTAALHIEPSGAIGHPKSGYHFTGDLVLDATGKLWLCVEDSSNGTSPGRWVHILSAP